MISPIQPFLRRVEAQLECAHILLYDPAKYRNILVQAPVKHEVLHSKELHLNFDLTLMYILKDQVCFLDV